MTQKLPLLSAIKGPLFFFVPQEISNWPNSRKPKARASLGFNLQSDLISRGVLQYTVWIKVISVIQNFDKAKQAPESQRVRDLDCSLIIPKLATLTLLS